MKQSNSDNNKMPSLHDCIALGQFEQGLSTSIEPRPDEFARLPTLLRLLSTCRPLVSVTTCTSKYDNDDNKSNNNASDDTITRTVSQRLEDRAAIYSSAESVEVVACHLAPAVCRKVSRWKQLEKVVSIGAAAATTTTMKTSPSSLSTSKRRKIMEGNSGGGGGGMVPGAIPDILQATSEDEGMDTTTDRSEDEDYQQNVNPQKRKRGSDPHQLQQILTESGTAATNTTAASTIPNTDINDDSAEATASKMLHELVMLAQQDLLAKSTSSFFDDFVLAQETRQPATGQCDLGAILVSLMHHAPVLKHKQVASALCLASVPQAATLIGRMGANVPAAIPCLVRGILYAYKAVSSDQQHQEQQQQQHRVVVSQTARKAIQQLAQLSPREKSRIRSMLQQEQVMMDVQLELAMEQDAMEALCLLIHELQQQQPQASQLDDLDAPETTASSSKRTSMIPKPTTTTTTTASSDNKSLVLRSLLQHLSENADFLVKTLQFLSKQCRMIEASPSWSRSSFVFSACTWTLCQVPINELWDKAKVRESIFALIDALDHVASCFSKSVEMKKSLASETTIETESHLDRPFSLFLCSLVSILMAVCAGERNGEHSKDSCKTECATVLYKALQTRIFSRRSNLTKATILFALTNRDPASLYSTMEDILGVTEKAALSRSDRIASMASAVCLYFREQQHDATASSIRALSEVHPVAKREDLLLQRSSLIVFLESDLFSLTEKKSRAKEALSILLEDKTCSLSFLRGDLTSRAISICLQTLLKESHTKIPFVMPITLEAIAMNCNHYGRLDTPYAAFLLNLLYCLEFLDREPYSPFKIDPRTMPLKEVFAFCEASSTDAVHPTLAARLKLLVAKLTPEIPFRACALQLLETSRHVPTDKVKKSSREEKNRLKHVMQESLRVKEKDSSGSRAEKAFLIASLSLSDSDLCTTTVSALLSTPGNPSPFFSYSMLYRDPLVILKCPLDTFQRKGWRRIVLYVLHSLTQTNDFAVPSAADKEAFGEYRYARNEVLLQSLTSIISKGIVQQCSMTVGLIRRIFAEGYGMVAMFVRQTDSDETIDWLVDNVPETIEDWKALSHLLSDRVSMTSLERLVTAGKIIRIIVVHGHRYEKESLSLAFAALSRFISSFFIVIGPVGVPVNSLVNEVTGADATKIARKAGFRILDALTCVRGYRRNLVNECGMCLQKLAGLCKGEGIVSGLSGSVAQRQKIFLKEFLDAIYTAADSMGCSSQI